MRSGFDPGDPGDPGDPCDPGDPELGNGKTEMGKGKWEMGKREMGNGKREMGNGKREMSPSDLCAASKPPIQSACGMIIHICASYSITSDDIILCI